MDLGLGNLATLKGHLLPASMITDTTYDTMIANLGKGIAGLLEGYCNRRFERVVGDTFECAADREQVFVPRYPVESVSKVESRYSSAEAWTQLTGQPMGSCAESGWVWFGAVQGEWNVRLRVTYTGGYWFDSAETGTGTLPTGATALPDDLKLAWLTQCAHVWASADRLGLSIGTEPNKQSGLKDAELLPVVKGMLARYVRYAMS